MHILPRRHLFNRLLGFSLVELLVVLSLMGLVASLAFPRIQSTLLAYERDSMVDILQVFLRQQIAHAHLTGQSFVIKQGQSFTLSTNSNSGHIEINFSSANSSLLPDIHYHANTDLRINTNGFCEAANIALVFQSASRVLQLDSPFCSAS